MIKHYYQPNGTSCGQTSLAMVTGMTPQESIKLFGHDNATCQPDHVRILKQLGYDVDDKFTKVDNRKKFVLPDLCMVRICKTTRRTGHMIVHYKGKFYDPLKGVLDSKEDLLDKYNGKWRIEYYLEVKGKNNSVGTTQKETTLQQVAGSNKKYKVRVSHDIHNKGHLQYIDRTMTEVELNNLKKSDKFHIEWATEVGE